MHRCFAEAASWETDRVTLSREESNHLLTVLRAAPGDKATVFDGRGRVAQAEVSAASRGAAVLRLLAPPVNHPRPVPAITLIQAIPKGGHMDQIVEKATELGVSSVVPIVTDRTVRRPGESQNERWVRVSVGAAKQCGTPWIPSISPVTTLDEALRTAAPPLGLLLVASLEPDSRPVRDVLREPPPGGCERVGILVGPEGDFTPDEYRRAREAGARPVSFGELVLRVETAALFGVSVIRYELGRAAHPGH